MPREVYEKVIGCGLKCKFNSALLENILSGSRKIKKNRIDVENSYSYTYHYTRIMDIIL